MRINLIFDSTGADQLQPQHMTVTCMLYKQGLSCTTIADPIATRLWFAEQSLCDCQSVCVYVWSAATVRSCALQNQLFARPRQVLLLTLELQHTCSDACLQATVMGYAG